MPGQEGAVPLSCRGRVVLKVTWKLRSEGTSEFLEAGEGVKCRGGSLDCSVSLLPLTCSRDPLGWPRSGRLDKQTPRSSISALLVMSPGSEAFLLKCWKGGLFTSPQSRGGA